MSPAKRYDPADEHDPLFDVERPRTAGDTYIKQAVKAVTRGKCSECNTERKVGLLRQGDHLVWREHWISTHGSAKLQCRGSLTRLCEHPADKVSGEKPPHCVCGGTT